MTEDANPELFAIAALLGILLPFRKQEVERMLNYLKHWNDKRPARDD